jgi:transcriptional regulator with PAS, ATPase and Fis domain
MIYKNKAMLDLVARAKQAAKYNYPVFITGESGTGKEGIANIIHETSRHGKPFIKVNCAAIPKELFEGEFFGSRKGSYTGALEDRAGLLRDAQDGTLFLDEVTEMPPLLQAKLLRVLQEKRGRALGESKDYPVECRFIAASNTELAVAVANGTFRKDLFFRLNVIPLDVPPLRDRQDEIPDLIDFFFEKFNKENKTCFQYSEGFVEKLLSHQYEGNVRELENLIYRTIIHHGNEKKEIEIPCFSDLQFASPAPKGLSLAELEKDRIMQLLRKTSNRKLIAAQLGISRNGLYYKMKQYGIFTAKYPKQESIE